MTTFQAIIYGILHGFTQFLPIDPVAHQTLVPYLIGWDGPEGALLGALNAGAFLAVLIAFRHDWASMISSLLQVILFRRRPMTIDERMPFFLMIALMPMVIAGYYLRPIVQSWEWTPVMVAGSLAAFGVPLWGMESFSKKNKAMSDWNGWDAAIIGVAGILTIVPGCGFLCAILIAGMARNYNRESAAKFGFFLLMPILATGTATHLREVDFGASAAMPQLSWLSFGAALVLTLLTGLLAIGGFMKNLPRKGWGQYVVYRWLLALGIAAVYWIRARGEG